MEILLRNLMADLVKWLERREAYAIKGPRQAGKTTTLQILKKHLIEQNRVPESRAVLINFEDPEVLEQFTKNPKAFVKSYLLEPNKRYFFLLDEYHKVPGAGQKLKLLWDTFENVKFIITGSSSLELTGAMAKFLVGRVFFFELLQLSWHEFLLAKSPRLANIYIEKHRALQDFILKGTPLKIEEDIFLNEFEPLFDEYVRFGGYPAVVKAPDAETKQIILKNIYATYISKDVIEWLKFTDTIKYHCLVRNLAALTGQLLRYEELADNCQSYYKEIKHLLAVLSETYIIMLLQPFFRNPLTELRKAPKVYFFDLGLRNYILKDFRPAGERADKGALVENFVLLALINSFKELKPHYWRTIAKAEVDFVLSLDQEPIPIEVKYQSLKEPKISRSFRAFINAYKPPRAIVANKDFWGSAQLGKTKIAFVPLYYL